MSSLPRIISLSEAAQKTGKHINTLRAMLRDGKVQGVEFSGKIFVFENTLPKNELKKEDLPEYKKYTQLRGVGIWISAAERKYGISNATLYRWTFKNHLIKVLGRDGQKVIVNEQDVAYCAEIYKRNSGQGKKVFNPDGTPYQK